MNLFEFLSESPVVAVIMTVVIGATVSEVVQVLVSTSCSV